MDDKVIKRSCYRVNFYVNGAPVTRYVCAENESAASAFLGVRDGSAAVSAVASPVEVDGIDKAHDPLPVPEIFKAPPEPPKQLSDAELARLREILARDKGPVPVATKP